MIEGTETLSVGSLVSRPMPFFVHIYQRAYAWEVDEVQDFVNDLKLLYSTRIGESPNGADHFFGGLVLIRRSARNTPVGMSYEVVDGQQRLTTFMITLDLIARALESVSEQARHEGDSDSHNEAKAHAQLTRDQFLFYQQVEGGQVRSKPRLTLSKADRVFFGQLLSGTYPPSKRESHKRLENARDSIQKDLIVPNLEAGGSAQGKLQNILTLKACLTEDCYVLHIVSDNQREAYQLFSVLNDRGRSLEDGDLLRSNTLELLEGHSDLQEQAERNWDKILAGTRSEVGGFLQSYYPSFAGKRISKRDFFDQFRKYFFPQEAPTLPLADAAKVEMRIADMKDASDTFSKISKAEWPYEVSSVSAWDRDRLYRLIAVLRHDLCIPLLLSAYYKLNEQTFSDLVFLVERFAFRYIAMVGAHPTQAGSIYYKHAAKIRQGGDYNLESLTSDLRNLVSERARNQLFAVSLENKLVYANSAQNRIIKHFLTTLEDHHVWFQNGSPGKPKPKDKMSSFDLSQITLEHIYPQNAKLRDPQLEELKHNIGNLTFWGPGENAEAGNRTFSEKRSAYARSNIKLTNSLAGLDHWKKQDLLERRKGLIRKALKLFDI